MSKLYKIKGTFEVPDNYEFDEENDIYDFFDFFDSYLDKIESDGIEFVGSLKCIDKPREDVDDENILSDGKT